MPKSKSQRKEDGGRLKIGDAWNAITIIALSQENPLKAIAEFVENSIDARAERVTITRGRERGEHFLMVADDGDGVPRTPEGIPDFHYVGTHICDSIKRQLKLDGAEAIQGEFGIGLLSFWTVGEELALSSSAADDTIYEMRMRKGDPSYRIVKRRLLIPEPGTRLKIKPLLPGIRQLSGEKIQWYLASELRERIRQSGVQVKVIDRHARKEYDVKPRDFTGQLLHSLPAAKSVHGDIYIELYLNESAPENQVGLYRSGTRILPSLPQLDAFQCSPWNEGFLQGIVDAPFLHLTPTTRTGVIQDEVFDSFVQAMAPVADRLKALIEEQKQAEEERTSRHTLRTIQRAFREAMLALPAEEYDWFDIQVRQRAARGGTGATVEDQGELKEEGATSLPVTDTDGGSDTPQKQFFEYAGPLHSVRILPASCVLAVGTSRKFHALARDRSGKTILDDLAFKWRVAEGEGLLEDPEIEFATYKAPEEPGLVRIEVTATQNDIVCTAEALITITDSLLPDNKERTNPRQGLPGYTFEHAPGQLWRSRYDASQNLIIVNSGHRDFIFASRKTKALKLRYITRLFAKEMINRNFPGLPREQLLERLIELLLYTEEYLR